MCDAHLNNGPLTSVGTKAAAMSDWSPCANEACSHLGVAHAANGPCLEGLCECVEFQGVDDVDRD